MREPLYLVAVTDAREPAARAARCLHYVHLSIVRILTGSIEKVLARDATYDLRALLGGTDRALRGMVEHARSRPDVMLDAVPCVPLPSATRAEFGRLLLLVQSECAVLFAVLCAHGMLVSAASPRRRPLSAPDLILLLSMLRTSPSLRASADESWVPVCLPGFAPSAFLHAHVSTLDGASDLTLLLLTHSAVRAGWCAARSAPCARPRCSPPSPPRATPHASPAVPIARRQVAAEESLSPFSYTHLTLPTTPYV